MSPSRPKPPEAVVDTDVLISGAGAFARPALSPEPIETTLLRRWIYQDWVWVVSELVLAEYEELLVRRDVPPSRVRYILSQIRARARSVVPKPFKGHLPDPGDAHVINTGRAGGAPIITRNVGDYPPQVVTGVEVLSPEEMMARVDAYLRHPMYRRPRTRD